MNCPKCHSWSVPVHRLPDGREFITDEAYEDFPEVRAFGRRFPNYWIREPWFGGYVGPKNELS